MTSLTFNGLVVALVLIIDSHCHHHHRRCQPFVVYGNNKNVTIFMTTKTPTIMRVDISKKRGISTRLSPRRSRVLLCLISLSFKCCPYDSSYYNSNSVKQKKKSNNNNQNKYSVNVKSRRLTFVALTNKPILLLLAM